MPLLATLYTIWTYGRWLRGDARGWEDDGVVYPPDPVVEERDQRRLAQPPFLFTPDQCGPVGKAIGESLVQRLSVPVLALSVQSWHAHFVVGSRGHDPPVVVNAKLDTLRIVIRFALQFGGARAVIRQEVIVDCLDAAGDR